MDYFFVDDDYHGNKDPKALKDGNAEVANG
jgi:hypothetical protein